MGKGLVEMLFKETREVRGVRYGRDNLGWIWRENRKAEPGEVRWFRTGFSTFEMIEAMR